MIHASLFSGIGGFDLAAEKIGWTNAFHCEWIDYKRTQLEINFPNSISYGDITTTDFTIHRGQIDVLTGGFPCQDASIAKQDGEGQQGLRGKRTGLFYEFIRAIEEIRPKYVIAENVANILKTNGSGDFSEILTELSRLGYNAEWRVCRASEVGAPHHRARLYLVAYPDGFRLSKGESLFSYVAEEITPFRWIVGRTSVQIIRGGWWRTEPPILCLDDGVSRKLAGQQIHGYGNAIIPELAFRVFKGIDNIEKAIQNAK